MVMSDPQPGQAPSAPRPTWDSRDDITSTDRDLPRGHDDRQVGDVSAATDGVRLGIIQNRTARVSPSSTILIGEPGNTKRGLMLLLWLKTKKIALSK